MTYRGSGDPARRLTLFDGSEVERTDYHPVWVNHLADDVTIEGSAIGCSSRRYHGWSTRPAM